MRKLFVFLVLSVFSLFGMGTSEELAPEIFQNLGREAQNNLDISKEMQTDIFVDHSCDSSSGTVMFYFPKTKRIYVTAYSLEELQKAAIGVLRFLLHHEATHKLHHIWHSRHIGPLKTLNEFSADLSAVMKCNCYKCLEEYRKAFYDQCRKAFFAKYKEMPDKKALDRIFAYREKDGYLSYDDLTVEVGELRLKGALCKHHCPTLTERGKMVIYKITGLFTEPLLILLNKRNIVDALCGDELKIL
ncbi:TPA: hypothetical protein DIC20_01220 [Candidatus Dependentiae bacterium]|nr:MAG: hypothetical protein US03_C0002G0148 [candidate division TM6 bacterium GW2011_GWF2_36_131]KKQ03581.1 MAG: hypothetical protein US13_C0002G0147 [candidate division TM6 bacterium GW2011_GWE2_36_25]KKQ20143.1 MAG: hypothetical protein US32_C0001G0040 [candidate division TM6 bacterium GW2011_GWA2_36_9]HBR70685.1 hypothetical protein [Candidatus Dependentiae bacterium]HCU00305.1 hypothetical protein [Candidatus Dependentiae bacterium]